MLLISDSALLPFSATGGGRKATSSPSYFLLQFVIAVTASDGDCYMSNFRPRQCGLFIVILSSTLSLKTVVSFYMLFILRPLSPRLKYSRIALCMDALPYAPYFRQRFAPFFRHRRRSQGYLKSVIFPIAVCYSGNCE